MFLSNIFFLASVFSRVGYSPPNSVRALSTSSLLQEPENLLSRSGSENFQLKKISIKGRDFTLVRLKPFNPESGFGPRFVNNFSGIGYIIAWVDQFFYCCSGSAESRVGSESFVILNIIKINNHFPRWFR